MGDSQRTYPSARLGQMVLGEELGDQIRRVIREQRHAGRIVERGLAPRRKLLLTGPPGTGKTLTASVLAGELGLPLPQVRLDGPITRYMGETAAKLRQIFEATGRTRGVYSSTSSTPSARSANSRTMSARSDVSSTVFSR